MPSRLPLFPLSAVLLPHAVLPLHVFEDRYRVLVRYLLGLPEDEQVFGVVAIRSGREVGADGVRALHEVGCTARLVRAREHEDGRFDIVTTGDRRFVLRGVEHDRPYLVGTVDWLDEPAGTGDLGALDAAVRTSYDDYLAALRETGADVAPVELPVASRDLSYAVARSILLDLGARQALLAEPDDVSRLRAERTLLRREARLIRELGATPAPDLTRVPMGLN
jgi:Lon protease-like protein